MSAKLQYELVKRMLKVNKNITVAEVAKRLNEVKKVLS